VRSTQGNIAVNSLVESFMKWWNGLAAENGKLKFRSMEEAAEFVRKVHEKNGGPNAKIRAMRKQYDDVNRSREKRSATGPDKCGNTAAFG
jgi:hypothetical protein